MMWMTMVRAAAIRMYDEDDDGDGGGDQVVR